MGTDKTTPPATDQQTPDRARDKDRPAAEDGALDSLGKAIVDPVAAGAEEEEPRRDGRIPAAPG